MDRREFVAVAASVIVGVDLARGKDRMVAWPIGFHTSRLQIVDEESSGGFLVPPEFVRDIELALEAGK